MHRATALLGLTLMGILGSCGEAFHTSPPEESQGGSAGQAQSGGKMQEPGEHESGDSLGGAGSPGAGESGAPAEPPLGSAGASNGEEPGEVSCTTLADCETGQNCIDALCVAALASCSAQKNRYAASQDGVYWIGSGPELRRAYCDMQLAQELCSEVEGEHQGKARDGSNLEFSMTSVLLVQSSECKLWNLRASDGFPIDQLVVNELTPAGRTCPSLGFIQDGKLGSCPFGSERSNCGFDVTPLRRYGNDCAGCANVGKGKFDHWVLQGDMKVAGTLSRQSGSIFTTCKVSK